MIERQQFGNEIEFFSFCTERIKGMAQANGNNTTSLDAFAYGLQKKPEIVVSVIKESNEIALQELDQNRWSTSSMILCVETALRYVASQYDAKLLYPSEWNTEKFLYYMENYQKQITESAGKNVLGRNLPQRAAWMIYLLNKSNNLSSSSFFIEIGAASGYILDALSKPNKFKEWIQDNHD